MKNGGAEVRLIRQETPNPDGSNYRGDLVRHARMVAEYDEPGSELVGFIIVGVFSDGTSSTGLRWDSKRSPIPRTLLPAFIAEIVRRDAVTSAEAEEIRLRCRQSRQRVRSGRAVTTPPSPRAAEPAAS